MAARGRTNAGGAKGGAAGGVRVSWRGTTPSELGRRLARAPAAVRRTVVGTFRREGPRIGKAMRTGGAASMPGGLADRVRRSTVSVSQRGGMLGRTIRVEVELRSPHGDALARLNAGELKHPVFGRAPWVAQRVPSGGFSRPAIAATGRLRTALVRDVRETIRRTVT